MPAPTSAAQRPLRCAAFLQFNPRDTLRFTVTGNWEETDVPTGPYQSKPTIAVYDGTFAGLDSTPVNPLLGPAGVGGMPRLAVLLNSS